MVLVYGRLSARKGIRQLVKAISGVASIANVKLLLAGAPDDDALEVLRSPAAETLRSAGRLVEFLRPIDGKVEEGCCSRQQMRYGWATAVMPA